MKVCATGVSGTIGRHLENCSKLEISLSPFSISGQQNLISKSDAVIHLAGIVGVSKVDQDLSHSYEVNVLGTKELARFVRDHSAGKFVFVSSSHVYEPSLETISEGSAIDPKSNYARQKLQAEEVLIETFSGYEDRLIICRVFSILGRTSNTQSLAGAITRKRLNSGDFPIQCGDDVRDFLSPKQAANLIGRLAKTTDAYGVFNVCSGEALTVKQAVEKFISKANLDHITVVPGNSTNPYLVGDNSKMLKKLNLDEVLWDLDD